ncbi:MAG: LacI family transcriptional regulator [Anaerolineae bacterium]|nr:LacI family transcriptional regulator [Anaerolineae bacterium]
MNTTKQASNDRQHARGRVSIKDIAQAAGVTHPTVSRALNDSPLINEETRTRIKAIAVEMGYIPNAVARSLKAQRSGTMGLVVTSLTDPFFSEVMAGVDEVASEAGLSMFVTASHNDPEREMEVVETFHRRRVEGIIVAASRLSSRYRQRLERIQVPIVLINQHTEDTQPRFHSVAFDEQAGAKLAAEHLVSLGHRRIGYLGLGNRQRSNRLRLAGYREALREAGIDADPAWALVVPEAEIQARGDNDVAESSCPSLLNSGVTAVLCYNDRVAIGALEACRHQGLVVPGTVSIVGFDDIELARWVSPALTTIRQPRLEMGCVAMKMMLDLLNDQPVDNRNLQPQLVIRQSSAPPA